MQWSCSGPLLEILIRNLIFHSNVCRTAVECSIVSDLEANYNNIHKVSSLLNAKLSEIVSCEHMVKIRHRSCGSHLLNLGSFRLALVGNVRSVFF